VDRVLGSDPGSGQGVDREAIYEQLSVCEASDWFWWLGAGNRAKDSAAFDGLFREHLGVLYDMLGEAPPDELTSGADASDTRANAEGAMRRANR
jgi:alpha-amylase/alpha-mannosidase (GH57 family)